MKVKKFEIRKKCIVIIWEKDGIEHTTLLYRHSDYTWHPDPDTANLLPVTKEELLVCVMNHLNKLSEKPKSRHKRRTVWFASDVR